MTTGKSTGRINSLKGLKYGDRSVLNNKKEAFLENFLFIFIIYLN